MKKLLLLLVLTGSLASAATINLTNDTVLISTGVLSNQPVTKAQLDAASSASGVTNNQAGVNLPSLTSSNTAYLGGNGAGLTNIPVSAISNLTPAAIGAVSNNAASIAAAGGGTNITVNGVTGTNTGGNISVTIPIGVTNGTTNAYLYGAVSIGTNDSTTAKLLLQGEAVALTNKPMLRINRTATATGNMIEAGTTGATAFAVSTIGAVTIGSNATVITSSVLNGTNGLAIVPPGSTNTYWILLGP